MPRTCTTCSNPHRDEIDRLLLAGTPLRNIAKQFSVSSANLFRHNKRMSKVLSNARQEADILRADSLMEQLNHLWAEAARLTQKAEQRKDLRTALAGVRERAVSWNSACVLLSRCANERPSWISTVAT